MTNPLNYKSDYITNDARDLNMQRKRSDVISRIRSASHRLNVVSVLLSGALFISPHVHAQSSILYDALVERPVLNGLMIDDGPKKIVVNGGPHTNGVDEITILDEFYNVYEVDQVDDVSRAFEFDRFNEDVGEYFEFSDHLLELKVVGNFKCDKYNNVDVEVNIWGGTKGNSVQGVAWCGSQKVVGSGPVFDPGNGTGNGIFKGNTLWDEAACSGKELRQGKPKSNWTVTCTFY